MKNKKNGANGSKNAAKKTNGARNGARKTNGARNGIKNGAKKANAAKNGVKNGARNAAKKAGAKKAAANGANKFKKPYRTNLASTPEEVWAMLGELAARMDQSEKERKETEKERKAAEARSEKARKRYEQERKGAEQERKIAEKEHKIAEKERKETEKKLAEEQKKRDAEHARLLKSIDDGHAQLQRAINQADGNFNNKWGQFMESLVNADLQRVLKERNIDIDRTQERLKFKDPRNRERHGEFDIVAYNTKQIVVTETKTTLRIKSIDYFEKNLNDFKIFFPEYKDKKIFGAMTHMGAETGAVEHAMSRGLFVIKAPSAESKITSIQNPKTFRPKEFAKTN